MSIMHSLDDRHEDRGDGIVPNPETETFSSSSDDVESIYTPQHVKESHSSLLQLMGKVAEEERSSSSVLDYARGVAERSGLSVDSAVVCLAYQAPLIPSSSNNPNSEGGANSVSFMVNANSHLTDGLPKTSQYRRHLNDVTTQTLSEHASRQTQLYGRMRGGLNAFPLILETTGGHSNTDHIIVKTGDEKLDRIAEYKRALKRRARAMRPEEKGDQRWDQPRIKGSRRRRILRQKDLPTAPPEPPSSGYVLFVTQMTAKMRHDREEEESGKQESDGNKDNNQTSSYTHNQIEAVGEISRVWKFDMTDSDRQYYIDFAREAKDEYLQQLREFRATGYYRQSLQFEKLLGDGPLVRKDYAKKNPLERELATYKTVVKAERTIFKEEKRAKLSADSANAAVLSAAGEEKNGKNASSAIVSKASEQIEKNPSAIKKKRRRRKRRATA